MKLITKIKTKIKTGVIVCSLTHTLPAIWLVVNNKATNNLKNSDRFMPGCKAAAGIPVSDISKETQVSRAYTYEQKASVQNYIETLDKEENTVLSINIDKSFIERMVLSLSLECQSSTEGIRRHPASIYGLHISYGKISSILAEASKRAEQFDASIPLDSIVIQFAFPS